MTVCFLGLILFSLSGCTTLLLPSGQPSGRISPPQPTKQKVYHASECIGPVILGRCHGTILPKSGYHPTCYGTWLNGRCIGPMF